FRPDDRCDRPRVLWACVAPDAADAGERMKHRLQALFRKELGQIRRDRRLAMSLIVPPILQILLFGFALDPEVSNLKLGIVDESRTPKSRDLVAAFVESGTFRASGYYLSADRLESALSSGELDVGIVVPYDFARNRVRGKTATVQLLLNAVNANTAAIGQGYAESVVAAFNRGAGGRGSPVALRSSAPRGQVSARVALLYNPGLVNSWFIVTGTFGVLIILNGSLVASSAMIKEKEVGTVEQLLMTPAGTFEVIAAKMTPLFLLLMLMVGLVMLLMSFVFRIPIRGSLLLVLFSAALCVLAGIAIGTFIATFAKSAQQTQLLSFFVNPPLAVLSGSVTPIEAMPEWLQPWTLLNPIRHFGEIARSALIKGSGLEVLWPNLLALAAFAVVLVSISVWRFRKQLG
ncbi:MAG: ABC transporter permease, partial [Bryobacteraceae bacterium]